MPPDINTPTSNFELARLSPEPARQLPRLWIRVDFRRLLKSVVALLCRMEPSVPVIKSTQPRHRKHRCLRLRPLLNQAPVRRVLLQGIVQTILVMIVHVSRKIRRRCSSLSAITWFRVSRSRPLAFEDRDLLPERTSKAVSARRTKTRKATNTASKNRLPRDFMNSARTPAIARNRHSGKTAQCPLEHAQNPRFEGPLFNSPEARSALKCSRMKRYSS